MQKSNPQLYIKLAAIFIIGLLLMVPATLIHQLINERESTRQQAIGEINQIWGRAQTLEGPVVTIPYTRYLVQYADEGEKRAPIVEHAHLLPTHLKITGDIRPEFRYRGIYEVVVYQAHLHISGQFSAPDLAALGVLPDQADWDKAYLTVGVSDLRGIEQQVRLHWEGDTTLFNPGVRSQDVISSGIHAPVRLRSDGQGAYTFALELDLKGSESLFFTPVGQTTDVAITSAWANPSFTGAFLPDERQVADTGFVARWNVLHLNRNYPQGWIEDQHNLQGSIFGINLLLPVDNYQKSYRAVRYAILFIGFTFVAFFFIEVLRKVFVHPIQYLLVGAALVVFYVLLLSLSEYVSFNIAFAVAAGATLALITGYVSAFLKSPVLTMLIAGLLLILYTFNFVIIQLQDTALLIGSIGVFLILGLVMYFSRKIDWYAISLNRDQDPSPGA